MAGVANIKSETIDIFLGQGFHKVYEHPNGDVVLGKGSERILYDTRRDKPIVKYSSNLNV